MWRVLVLCLCVFASTNGQKNAATITPTPPALPVTVRSGLTERIGNFSIELLYHTSIVQPKVENLIMSPMTVWTVLAVISEGAAENTANQINNAIRVSPAHRESNRLAFGQIYEWLKVNTSTVELTNLNNIFVDNRLLLSKDFQLLANSVYHTLAVPLDFMNSEQTANTINDALSKVTHGRIPKLVEAGDLQGTKMILTSALYFKGQWTFPFNTTSTTKMPFHNSSGQIIGNVNMMYNRFTYPFASIPALEAKVIELSYGVENRLSMLIMLPNPGVSLENMFLNFGKVPLDTLFSELKIAKEEFGEEEVDCFIPRFKIESNLDLTPILKRFNIVDLFDESRARLQHMARMPLYVSKVIHKAEIEVTEQGTTASAVTAAEFSNRIGIVQFLANRPFCYLIVEKVTNSIVFGGFYAEPHLY